MSTAVMVRHGVARPVAAGCGSAGPVRCVSSRHVAVRQGSARQVWSGTVRRVPVVLGVFWQAGLGGVSRGASRQVASRLGSARLGRLGRSSRDWLRRVSARQVWRVMAGRVSSGLGLAGRVAAGAA